MEVGSPDTPEVETDIPEVEPDTPEVSAGTHADTYELNADIQELEAGAQQDRAEIQGVFQQVHSMEASSIPLSLSRLAMVVVLDHHHI